MATSMATTLSASHALSSAGLLANPTPTPAASRRSFVSLPVVVSAADASHSKVAVSRRQVAVSLTALSVALFASSQGQAEARDIPLFGLKKAKKITEQVVQEVKELVKEGEGEVAAVGGAISGAVAEFPGAALPNIPSGVDGGLSPALQAGVVAGAGVVGVLVASTVVNSLVSPAK
ncbi:hypothetical protein KC19_5G077800 [Ceratodon purpureus]|uniref:Uncharacterized protein n=1 Tax=Ceratodon purpureus TaxID=3225 RepID=A0A8T0HZT8_CERPU|nr:hypothetical protein KC19_5G077800 [Ceratodon purpureus]